MPTSRPSLTSSEAVAARVRRVSGQARVEPLVEPLDRRRPCRSAARRPSATTECSRASLARDCSEVGACPGRRRHRAVLRAMLASAAGRSAMNARCTSWSRRDRRPGSRPRRRAGSARRRPLWSCARNAESAWALSLRSAFASRIRTVEATGIAPTTSTPSRSWIPARRATGGLARRGRRAVSWLGAALAAEAAVLIWELSARQTPCLSRIAAPKGWLELLVQRARLGHRVRRRAPDHGCCLWLFLGHAR